MINRFILNEVSYFGAGARKQLPEVLSRMNLKKALVCSDKGLIKVGTTKMVTDVLDEIGFEYDIYSEIKPNPTVTNVQMGVEVFKESGADCLIAIGGGSSIDVAKSIREDYLQQNSFHEVDTYTSMVKQHKMLKNIYDYYRLSNDALSHDVDYADIINLPVKDKIGRAKYIPEENIKDLDAIDKEISDSIKTLINGGENA